MVVDFNTGGSNFIPLRTGAARRADVGAGDALSLDSAQFTRQAVRPEVQARPEKVAAAQALLNDSNYPSDAALNRLAGFLASRL